MSSEPTTAAPSDELYDITIIGGGPAGMYAAFYAGMRDMKVKLIEGKDYLGGFLHHYAEKTIWDVGGIPPIRCDRLIEWLAGQARTFDPTIVFNQRVDHMERLSNGAFRLQTSTGENHHTKTIIVAVGRGITDLTKLNIEGADRYELTNLNYTVQNFESFRGKVVVVSGGGNSAVDWANELADVASKVVVVHRRTEFQAMERSVSRMYEAADVRTPYVLQQLHGEGDAIRSVTIAHAETGAEERIAVDAVVVSHGYSKDYGELLKWGLDISHKGVRVSEQAESNIDGIYVAGDCADYSNKVKLIAGAFTDAVLAVNSAVRYMDAEAHEMAYVSSHNEKFRELNEEVRKKLLAENSDGPGTA